MAKNEHLFEYLDNLVETEDDPMPAVMDSTCILPRTVRIAIPGHRKSMRTYGEGSEYDDEWN